MISSPEAAPVRTRRGGPGLNWDANRQATLERDAGKVPADHLAVRLGISRATLYKRAAASSLSLVCVDDKGLRDRKPKAIDEVELRKLAGTMQVTSLAEHLGVAEITLRRRAMKLGIDVAYREPTVAPATADRDGLADAPPATAEPVPAVRHNPRATTLAPGAGATGKVRLRAAPGVYLHFSCEQTTDAPVYAWEGTREQLKAVWAKWPWTRKLTPVAIVKSPELRAPNHVE